MDELQLESWRTAATVLAALCAVISASVAVAVYRRARSTDLANKIKKGDAELSQEIGELREGFAEAIDELKDSVARIEASQEIEAKHMVKHSDLSALHEKVNRVAQDTASVRASQRAIEEQLRIIQQHLMRGVRS